MEEPKLVPWDDCKVAFGVDADADALFAWAERFAKHFPKGWKFDGTDSSGARMVALFSVQGIVDRADGETVAKSLRSLEAHIQEEADSQERRSIT